MPATVAALKLLVAPRDVLVRRTLLLNQPRLGLLQEGSAPRRVAAVVSRGRAGGGAGGGGSTGLRAEHGGAGAARCGAGGSAGLRAERGGAGAARSVLTAASMAGSRGFADTRRASSVVAHVATAHAAADHIGGGTSGTAVLMNWRL